MNSYHISHIAYLASVAKCSDTICNALSCASLNLTNNSPLKKEKLCFVYLIRLLNHFRETSCSSCRQWRELQKQYAQIQEFSACWRLRFHTFNHRNLWDARQIDQRKKISKEILKKQQITEKCRKQYYGDIGFQL
jgi:hypothetical protein